MNRNLLAIFRNISGIDKIGYIGCRKVINSKGSFGKYPAWFENTVFALDNSAFGIEGEGIFSFIDNGDFYFQIEGSIISHPSISISNHYERAPHPLHFFEFDSHILWTKFVPYIQNEPKEREHSSKEVEKNNKLHSKF